MSRLQKLLGPLFIRAETYKVKVPRPEKPSELVARCGVCLTAENVMFIPLTKGFRCAAHI